MQRKGKRSKGGKSQYMRDKAIKEEGLIIDELKKLNDSNNPNTGSNLSSSSTSNNPNTDSKLSNSNSNNPDSDIEKSDLSEYFNTLIDNYRDYMSGLTTEQLAILVNMWGLGFALNLTTSIILVLIGNQIIKFFKLESKYPKLAKYIKYRQTISKVNLLINLA
jgi:hypothetical protein